MRHPPTDGAVCRRPRSCGPGAVCPASTCAGAVSCPPAGDISTDRASTCAGVVVGVGVGAALVGLLGVTCGVRGTFAVAPITGPSNAGAPPCGRRSHATAHAITPPAARAAIPTPRTQGHRDGTGGVIRGGCAFTARLATGAPVCAARANDSARRFAGWSALAASGCGSGALRTIAVRARRSRDSGCGHGLGYARQRPITPPPGGNRQCLCASIFSDLGHLQDAFWPQAGQVPMWVPTTSPQFRRAASRLARCGFREMFCFRPPFVRRLACSLHLPLCVLLP